MNKYLALLAAITIGLAAPPARAQFEAAGVSPMDETMSKVFGTNLNFSADMETQIKMMPKQENMAMNGRIFFAGGNSRTEIDMTSMQGRQMTPQAAAQMKAMGMDKMIAISHTDTKAMYMIYPGLQAYAKIEMPDPKKTATNDFKVQTIKLGEETVDGYPCDKNQYTVNNSRTGMRLIMTTWNATDLKNIPIKIAQSAWASTDSYDGTSTTMHFTHINPTQPDASLFEPPAGFKKYDNIQTMMQAEVMKKMGGQSQPAGR